MAKQKTMKLSKKRAGITIGIGLTCAAVAVAPVVGQYLSKEADAARAPACVIEMPKSWDDITISNEAFQDLINSVEASETYNKYAKFFDVYYGIDWNGGEAGKEALATMKQEIADAGIDMTTYDSYWNSMSQLDNAILTIELNNLYNSNNSIKTAVDKARLSTQDDFKKAEAAALELNPDVDLSKAVSFQSIREALETPYDNPEKRGYSEYYNYYDLYEIIKLFEKNEVSATNDFYFLAVCDAKQANPDFQIQYNLAANPVAGLEDPWAKNPETPSNPGTGDDNKEEEEKPSTPSTPSTPVTSANPNTEKLQSVIDQIKADPTYQKWYRLIKLVEEAERILASLKGEGLGAVEPQQMVDQPYVANAIQARTASIVLAAETTTPTQNLANTIKAIGDAMRDLGIETTLGQGLGDSATQEDLVNAISSAKGTVKYTEYAELVRIMEEAELAIKNGTADDKILNNLAKALADTAKKLDLDVKMPNTGVLGLLGNSEATATILTATAVASVLALITIVILHRSKKNKEKFIF